MSEPLSSNMFVSSGFGFRLTHDCVICRAEVPLDNLVARTAHDACVTCPECRSTFVVWQGPSARADKIASLRCCDCLHHWRGKPEHQETQQVTPP